MKPTTGRNEVGQGCKVWSRGGRSSYKISHCMFNRQKDPAIIESHFRLHLIKMLPLKYKNEF